MPTRVNNSKEDRALPCSVKPIAGTRPSALCRSILDSIADGISIHSLSSEITWANKELGNIYCRPLSEFIDRSCNDVFHRDELGCPHERVLATGHGAYMVDELRGSGRMISVAIEPMFTEDNEPCGFLRVVRDLTSELGAQQQLLKAERFATLGQLLSSVLHDVGTPLNVISGYAEFLLMRTKPDDQGYKELSAIRDQTRRIAAMFGQALDLARPAQGRIDAVDIETLLTDSLALVGHHLRNAGVTASVTCRINKPLVYGEASQLRQAIFNLLLNSVQHIGAGGRLHVVLEEATNNPGFLGLAFLGTEASGDTHDFAKSLAALFDEQSGTGTAGIGIYLTKKILAEAGARVTQAGEQGGGLVIYLPADAGGRP